MITYVRGDATNPLGPGNKCIVHIVNDAGRWGAGFVMALSKKWPKTREEYIRWYGEDKTFALGRVLLTQVRNDIWIANMVAQKGIKTGSQGPPIRYVALEQCLHEVGEIARERGWSLHLPKIGTGLAGGSWAKVEPIVERTLDGLSVTVYDL
jgi:O-acetyl-ADP-ribose deacetylase (regulator of RNase III)